MTGPAVKCCERVGEDPHMVMTAPHVVRGDVAREIADHRRVLSHKVRLARREIFGRTDACAFTGVRIEDAEFRITTLFWRA